MSKTIEQPLPLEVGGLGNLEARMLRNFRAAIDDWDEVCSALGRWEAQHLASGDNAAAKAQHRRWLEQLLSWGRLVQRTTDQEEFPERALARRVRTRIRHLEDKLALWHASMTPEEEERIVRAAFS